jgi:predicted phosphodiesterase
MAITRILHLSDLHFHSTAESNAALIETLGRFPADVDLLLVTGDVTDDGGRAQYQQAAAALEHWEHVFLVPGNHDFGWAGIAYDVERAHRFDEYLSLPRMGHRFSGATRPAMRILDRGPESPAVLIVGLDSNLETTHPFDFAAGQVGTAQRRGLDAILSCVPMLLAIVCLHHHPWEIQPWLALQDGRDLMRLLYGRAELLCFGHRHVPDHWRDRCGIPLILSGGTPAWGAWLIEIDGAEITARHLT